MNFKVWFLAFSFSFFTFSAAPANSLPTAEDINNLTESAKLTTNTFMQQSFKLRMGYEYAGQFLNHDESKLYELAKKAADHLEEIAKNQKTLQHKIEDYQGNDWDARYGSTGLWRKLSADLYTTTLSKCQVDFYLALSSQQPQRNKICDDILAQIDSLNKTYNSTPSSQLLRARTFTLLSQTDPAYQPLAKKEFDILTIQSDMGQSTAFRIAIEKVKLLGETKPGQLNTLTEELSQSSCVDDLELVLCLAFLQRQYGSAGFEKTVQLFPQTENFVGSLVLSDLSNRVKQQQSLQEASVFEAELATLAAWGDETDNHKMLLDSLLSTDKFQTPLIVYVAAVAFAESSPTKAANLLVEASKLQGCPNAKYGVWGPQQLQKSGKLDVRAHEIAKQAAQLAYNLFAEDSLHCRLALEAFENYCEIAGEKIDEELEYLYTVILNDCGQAARSKELLQKIADRPAGNWRNRARLDLIIKAMQQTQNENRKQRNVLLEQLRNFILNCHGQDKTSNSLRNEAITIYCQTLLEFGDELSAQKVLDILDRAETTRGIRSDLFKSRALQQLGRLKEAVHHMVSAIRLNSGSLGGVVLELLAEVIEKIDRYKADSDNEMMQNCKKLADFSYVSVNNRKSGLILAEISIFEANKNQGKLLQVEKLLNNLAKDSNANDVDLLRCLARLFAEHGKFDEAAGLWSQICKIRKNDTRFSILDSRYSNEHPANQRSWKWWRAKFYELDCCAKWPTTKKENILHTIKVLENSFRNIPPLWAKKLNLLKQQYRKKKQPSYKKQTRNEISRIVDGKYDRAIEKMKAYLKGHPKDLESLYGLAVAYSQKQNIGKAIAYVEQSVDAGLPFSRFLAGPRSLLKPLTDSAEFKVLASKHAVELLHGPMLGCVTDSSAKFWVRTANEVPVQILVYEPEKMDSPVKSAIVKTSKSKDFTAVVAVKGLKSDIQYYYELLVNGKAEPKLWSFRTFPALGTKVKFQIGFGGGAGYTPQHEGMWNTIVSRNPAAFLFLGDNVYIDHPEQPAVQQYCYYRRQSRPEFRLLCSSVPIYAIWDDHDFGTNDCIGGPDVDKPKWKKQVWRIFRNDWNNPSYGGEENHPGCWFDFSIGDVDFFMLDGRYYRTDPKKKNPTMLGPVQKEWLFKKLKSSAATFKVLASPVSWAFGTKPGSLDTWEGYKKERAEVFSFLEENKIEGVILISADRHRSDAWKIERPNGYALYEFESSKLTNIHTHKLMPGALLGYNRKCSFGLLSFDTTIPDPEVIYQVINIDNKVIHKLSLKHSQMIHKKTR